MELTGTPEMERIKLTNVAAEIARLKAVAEKRRAEEERKLGIFKP